MLYMYCVAAMPPVLSVFACFKCQKSFARYYDKNRHERICKPKTTRIFYCKYCGKIFDNQSNVNRHQRTGPCANRQTGGAIPRPPRPEPVTREDRVTMIESFKYVFFFFCCFLLFLCVKLYYFFLF